MYVIQLKLKQFLKLHGISAYELGKSVEGISPKTIYMYVNGQRHPSLAALDKLIEALRRLTDEPVDVGDVLKYEQVRLSPSDTARSEP